MNPAVNATLLTNRPVAIQSDVASVRDLWQCDAGKGHESDPIKRSMTDANPRG